MRRDGAAFEAAENVGVEVEFCEMMMQDYALGGEFADAFVEF